MGIFFAKLATAFNKITQKLLRKRCRELTDRNIRNSAWKIIYCGRMKSFFFYGTHDYRKCSDRFYILALSSQFIHIFRYSKVFSFRKPPGSCFSASWTLFFGCFGYFAYRSKSVAIQSGLTEAKSQSKFCNSAVKKQFPMGIWKKKENSNCEILAKKNPTYLVLLVEYRSLKFAIPFRSNIQHSHAYK